ncbi:hypothetical protein CVT25_006996 [Psilocybe cyanescens]|uniref:glucan endo-1,3-beta-D-glucosidase n=1 Tax=Psilocybe cyanescens TaxID=93625 RepID=A0A409WYE3_PSICY|nr:hypothetical protein CVT25_006996 [Psilocybe cyanescens]
MIYSAFTSLTVAVLLGLTGPSLGTNHISGLAVSNSAGGTGTYSCRSQDQWNQLANDAKGQGFRIIRIIGFDCNALDMASSAAAAAGLQVMAGIYAQSVSIKTRTKDPYLCAHTVSSQGTIAASMTQINNDVQTFRTAYAKYGAGRYVGLTIGNEVADSVGNIMAKVYDVRGYLGSVDVTTPVSTVHTWVDIRSSPDLCGADFVGANAHAFYDGGVNSGQAGSFLYNTVKPALQAACPGKKIYITETGWPSRGSNNGNAVPSVPDEHDAISSINCAARDTSMTIFGFEYDDQMWKTSGAWNQVANDAKAQGFKSLRILGFDCNALDMASTAAAAAGLQIMAGIFAQSGTIASSMSQINNDVQTFRAAYNKYGAGRYIGLTIGNEVADSVSNIMAKVYDVRGYLGSVGVHTPVSTVHTWVDIRNNPALCGADFVGANAHAFYDGGVTSGQAGDFLFKTVRPALKAACPGKKIYITETGWPSRGSNNGKAVPSVSDERNALLNINCACRDDTSVSVFAFEYDDQLWKSNDNERSFGIFPKIKLQGDAFNPC